MRLPHKLLLELAKEVVSRGAGKTAFQLQLDIRDLLKAGHPILGSKAYRLPKGPVVSAAIADALRVRASDTKPAHQPSPEVPPSPTKLQVRSFTKEKFSATCAFSAETCSYCGRRAALLWAINPAAKTHVFCRECFWSRASTSSADVEIYFPPLEAINGVWFRPRNADFESCLRTIESFLDRPRVGANPAEVESFDKLVRRMNEYVLDATEIPHWRSQIEYIDQCSPKLSFESRAEVNERKEFLGARIDAAWRLGNSSIAEMQLRALDRLRRRLRAWIRGEVFIEPAIPLIRVEWELLPAGEWGNVLQYLASLTHYSNHERDDRRIKLLHDLRPDLMFVGKASFEGYVGFVFDRAKAAVLESPYMGNALYMLDSREWRALSKMTKGELVVRAGQAAV